MTSIYVSQLNHGVRRILLVTILGMRRREQQPLSTHEGLIPGPPTAHLKIQKCSHQFVQNSVTFP